MHILLINTNPVVSRLISLCMRDDDMFLEEVTDIATVKRERYDMVFVDDASYTDVVKIFVDNMMVKKRVYLSVSNYFDEAFEGFDEVIKKPFLPSQITAAIESLKILDESMKEIAAEEESDDSFIFPLSTDTEVESEDTVEEKHDNELLNLTDENEEAEETSEMVLDSSEIERIKALLEDDEEDDVLVELDDEDEYESRKVEVITEHLEADGLEIVSEDDMINILSENLPDEEEPKKVKDQKTKSKKEKMEKKKVKKEKKSKKIKEEVYTFEEALIAAVEGMKPKKIKKLLKDAEVTITINFKDKK